MITAMQEASGPVSKTRRKQEMHELQALGAALVELPEARILSLELADDGALTELLAAHPGADAQALRTLIRNARREQKEGRPPRAFRELFRALKSLEAGTSPPG